MFKSLTSDNISLKRVVAVLIISMIFAAFTDIMSPSVANTIASALISSKFDYCNFLHHNVTSKNIAKLQHVQNCLTRVVSQSPCFSCSVPLLISLHWLVRCRITFMICSINYQALSSKQPSYLLLMLTPVRQHIQLRLSSPNLLTVPRVKTRLELELSQLPQLLCGTHVLTTLNQQKTLLHFAVT